MLTQPTDSRENLYFTTKPTAVIQRRRPWGSSAGGPLSTKGSMHSQSSHEKAHPTPNSCSERTIFYADWALHFARQHAGQADRVIRSRVASQRETICEVGPRHLQSCDGSCNRLHAEHMRTFVRHLAGS